MNGNLIALKITVIKEESRICPRGGSGCGVCTSLDKDFEITEEMDNCSAKDTSKLLAAGASKVYWLRVREDSVTEGMEAILKIIHKTTPVICESNSIMTEISPALFILLKSAAGTGKKKSAAAVEDKADLILETSPESSNFNFSRLQFEDSQWILKS